MSPRCSKDGPEFCPKAVVKACTSIKELMDEYPVVQKRLAEWITQRRKTIDTISRLQKKIDSIFLGASVARGAGATLGIVGGITGIVGVVSALTGKDNASKLLNRSTTMNLLGSATSVSATLVELGLSQSIIDEIKMELKTDQDLAELLFNWIQRSRTLDSLLVKIFGCSIQSDNISNVMAICSECITILRIGQYEVGNMILDISCGEMCSTNPTSMIEQAGKKVYDFLRIIQEHPELREPLGNICNILQESPLILEFSKLSLKVFFEMKSAMSYDVFPSLLSVGGLNFPKTSTGVLITRGAFDAVNIAADVLSIIFAARDISEGKSKYSEQLDQLKVALSMELNAALNNYPDLNKNELTLNDT